MRRTLLALFPLVLTAQAAPPPAPSPVEDGDTALGEGRYVAARDAFATAAFDASGRMHDDLAFSHGSRSAPC